MYTLLGSVLMRHHCYKKVEIEQLSSSREFTCGTDNKHLRSNSPSLESSKSGSHQRP